MRTSNKNLVTLSRQGISRRTVLTSTVAAGVGIAVGANMPRAFAATPIMMKLAHGATAQLSIGKGILKFVELVGEKTHGAVQIKAYLGGSLYSETTALEALVSGAVDFAGASNANWAQFTDAFLFMDLPYVFKDQAALSRLVKGWLGQEIGQKLDAKGFKLLMLLENGGFRDVVNTERPIRVPSDMKGLKMRTTASPVEQAMFREWGAIPTSIDWSQVYTALASGVIDGEFVMPDWLATAKHYEVLKYGTHEKAVIGVQTIAMRKERFEKLPSNIQKQIVAAGEEATGYSNKVDEEQMAAALEVARKLGVKYYTPTADEMKIWRSTGKAIWKQFSSTIDMKLVQKIVASQA